MVLDLYGQGRSGRKGPFYVRESQGMSGNVRETCNGQGKIAFSYFRSGRILVCIITEIVNLFDLL